MRTYLFTLTFIALLLLSTSSVFAYSITSSAQGQCLTSAPLLGSVTYTANEDCISYCAALTASCCGVVNNYDAEGGYLSNVCTARTTGSVTAASNTTRKTYDVYFLSYPVVLPPTATLSASSASIVSGSSATLTWSSANATACGGVNFNTASTTSGTASVSPTVTTSYSVRCISATSAVTATTTITVTAAQPDVVAGGVTPITATVGTPVTLTGTITNSGSASTGAGFTNLFQRATDAAGTGSTDIGTYAASAVAAAGNTSATLSYTFPSAATWYVRLCADKSSAASTGSITESNEANNCGAWTAVTASAPLPDLTASAPVLASGMLYTGNSLIFIATTTNSGTATATQYYSNRFQIDLNSDGSYDTNLDAASSTNTLNPSQNKQVVSPAWVATVGTHTIRLCTDIPPITVGVVPESNENNNCGATYSFTVVTNSAANTYSATDNTMCSSGTLLGTTRIFDEINHYLNPGEACRDYCSAVSAACCTEDKYIFNDSANPEPLSFIRYTCSAYTGTAITAKAGTFRSTPPPGIGWYREYVESWSATLITYGAALSSAITANAIALTLGDSSLLTWTATGVNACVQSATNDTWYTTSGAQTVIFNERLGTSYDCAVAASDSGYAYWNQTTIVHSGEADPIETICVGFQSKTGTVAKPSTTSGNTSTSYKSGYTCSGAVASCTGTGFNAGAGSSGSALVAPTATTNYFITCSPSTGTWHYQQTYNTALSCPISATTLSNTYSALPDCPSNPAGVACTGGTCKVNSVSSCSINTLVYECLDGYNNRLSSTTDKVRVDVTDVLAASCKATPNSAAINTSVNWTSTVTGGVGGYTYTWTGSDSLTGDSQSVAKTYSSVGSKTATLTVQSSDKQVTVSCTPVTITEGPNTDLSAGTPSLYTGVNEVGNAVTFQGTITNVGDNTVSGSFQNRFQVDINADGSYDLNLDVPSASRTVALGGTATVVSPQWTNLPGGIHHVRFCSDIPSYPNGSIAEVNEANNCGSDMTLAVGQSLLDMSITASTERVVSGSQVTISWSAANADSCTVSGTGLSSSALTGSAQVTVTGERTYTITCTRGSLTDSKSVQIRLAPRYEEI